MSNEELSKQIVRVLKKAKKELTLLEIRKTVSLADRTLMRKLVAAGKLKKKETYLKNSAKTFRHPNTGKIETIKGTMVYKYGLVKNN